MPDLDFSEDAKLARYVRKEWRQPNGRPVPLVFRKNNPDDKLSVNTLSIETERQIAASYASKWETDVRPVAMTVCEVKKYVDASKFVGVELSENKAEKNWSFQSASDIEPAFSHTPKDWSESHSECNFTATFGDFQDFKFAGRMASGTTYKMR